MTVCLPTFSNIYIHPCTHHSHTYIHIYIYTHAYIASGVCSHWTITHKWSIQILIILKIYTHSHTHTNTFTRAKSSPPELTHTHTHTLVTVAAIMNQNNITPDKPYTHSPRYNGFANRRTFSTMTCNLFWVVKPFSTHIPFTVFTARTVPLGVLQALGQWEHSVKQAWYIQDYSEAWLAHTTCHTGHGARKHLKRKENNHRHDSVKAHSQNSNSPTFTTFTSVLVTGVDSNNDPRNLNWKNGSNLMVMMRRVRSGCRDRLPYDL